MVSRCVVRLGAPEHEAFGCVLPRVSAPAGLRQLPFVGERAMMSALKRRIGSVLEHEHGDPPHAHRPSFCGLPALKEARRESSSAARRVRFGNERA